MSSVDLKKRVRDLLTGTYAVNGYYGFPDLVANTNGIVDEIYDEAGYTSTELTQIKTWFSSQSEIPVLREFPRKVKDLPALFVFRMSDSEMERGLIGDLYAVGDGTDPDTQAKETYGTILDEQIGLHLWAIEASQRDDLYIAARELILRGRLWFASLDCVLEWKNGKDGQMYDPSSEPHIIHRAEATLFCKASVQWAVEGDKVLDIISREKQPSPSSKGEVTAIQFQETSNE